MDFKALSQKNQSLTLDLGPNRLPGDHFKLVTCSFLLVDPTNRVQLR